VARSTIAGILQRHGIEPAPERKKQTSWKEFLTRHWELIVAADFFTVEATLAIVPFPRGLPQQLLAVISLPSRSEANANSQAQRVRH
jgi:hypothetical protein